MIARGAVTINGRIARAGDQADPDVDDVRVNGRAVRAAADDTTIAFNKPAGIITSMRDERGRPCVGDVVKRWRLSQRIFPVGRLDAQTSGLLLLTSDGELARKLLHPSFEVERRYRVSVTGLPSASSLRRMRAQHVKAQKDATCFELLLRSGANREIRRACAREGLRVLSLERIAYGPIALERMKPGAHRVLSSRELRQLKRAVGDAPEKGPSRAD